jgi:hypothetical protein
VRPIRACPSRSLRPDCGDPAVAEAPRRLAVIGQGHGGLALTMLASEARYDVVVNPDRSRTARLRQDEVARPILGQGCGLNLRNRLFRSSMILLLYRASERSYSGARAALATRVAHLINILVWSVNENAAPARSTLDVLPTCLTAGAGRATHKVVIRSDDDEVDCERADRRIPDYRSCLTSAIVECL